MQPSESPGVRETLGVLRPGPFRRYMIGESISSTGTWMQMMAQSWVMTTLTHSNFMLGLVTFASGVPQLLLTMHGGSFADRYDKRMILQITQVVQIVLALVTGWLVMTNRILLWQVIAMAAILGVSNAFEMPAASALVPELVEKREIASAIAVDRSSFHTTRLIGPALAGLMVGLWGAASAFFANALSFVALMLALSTLPKRMPGNAEEEEQRAGGMKEGFAFVRQDKPTLAMIALLACSTVFVFPLMTVMLPLYSTQVVHLGADALGMLMGLSGLGSLTGSIGLLAVPREKRRGRMAVGALGIVVALVLLAVAQGAWMLGAGLCLLSVNLSTMFGLANTTVQERAPDYLRGRVSAVAGLSFFGLMPIAGLGITSLADLVGDRYAIGLAAAAYGLASALVLAGPARAAFGRVGEPAVPLATVED